MQRKSKLFSGKRIHVFEIEYDSILIELYNPERRNAMDLQMAEEAAQVSSHYQDWDPRCAVLTGAGEAFSAGGDLNLLISLTEKPA
ncbi:MAG: hypothetical protein D6767_03605, partial [Candidatus Hydrogenedentota bacterium]